MTTPAPVVALADRFYELAPENARERERQQQGWIWLRDRATNGVFTIWAPDRDKALWCLRALNLADRTHDRLGEQQEA